MRLQVQSHPHRRLQPDLDVGRATRTVGPALWNALVARDRHCTAPGCTRGPADCEAHHIVHWSKGGPTNLDNLKLLCWNTTANNTSATRPREPRPPAPPTAFTVNNRHDRQNKGDNPPRNPPDSGSDTEDRANAIHSRAMTPRQD